MPYYSIYKHFSLYSSVTHQNIPKNFVHNFFYVGDSSADLLEAPAEVSVAADIDLRV